MTLTNSFKGTFYITITPTGWYNLRLNYTHFCLSCGTSLEVCKEVMVKYMKKYKTPDKLYKAVSLLSNGGRVGETTYNHLQDLYDSGAHLPYKSFVDEVVDSTMEYLKNNNPMAKIKRVVRKSTIEKVSTVKDLLIEERSGSGALILPKKIKRVILPAE